MDLSFSNWENSYFESLPEEQLTLIDGTAYLYIQSCDEGYDYTIYDAVTKAELDGGVLTAPKLSFLQYNGKSVSFMVWLPKLRTPSICWLQRNSE